MSNVSASTTSRIPSTAHFVWYGSALPWVHALAIKSALERGGFSRVLLHCSHALAADAHFEALGDHTAFEARRIDLSDVFSPFGQLGLELAALHERLGKSAARANVLRAAVLAQHGGVYLDTDTITLRSLEPLLEAELFCGEELVAFPASVFRQRGSAAFARALALHGLRATCKHVPDGVRWFQRIASHYARSLNNAVLGATPMHPFLLAMLERMVAMPPARQRARFALGTHLLQRLVDELRPRGLVVHAPEVFYPLPPEISHHWFRVPTHIGLTRVIAPETRVVHWYASVENRALGQRIDSRYVAAHRDTQLFSALVAPFALP
jgi:hypothetical protein